MEHREDPGFSFTPPTARDTDCRSEVVWAHSCMSAPQQHIPDPLLSPPASDWARTRLAHHLLPPWDLVSPSRDRQWSKGWPHHGDAWWLPDLLGTGGLGVPPDLPGTGGLPDLPDPGCSQGGWTGSLTFQAQAADVLAQLAPRPATHRLQMRYTWVGTIPIINTS